MPIRRAIALGLVLPILAAFLSSARADDGPLTDLPALPDAATVWPPQAQPLDIPEDLPRYDLDVRLDVAGRLVTAREVVNFTNRTDADVAELVFHVYPRYKMPEADGPIFSKTLEVLRLSPDEAMDRKGERLKVQGVRRGESALRFDYDPNDGTLMTVALDAPLKPGAEVEVVIDFQVELPDFWGRWGQHKGVTYLLNWYPVLAHHDVRGFDRTPYVPWHQPWHQEAGHYVVRLSLPGDQIVASTGSITRTDPLPGGWQRHTIEAHPARDFALVCSNRFRVWEKMVDGIKVRVTAFAEHESSAEKALEAACEVIPLYQRWFGPYPYDEFDIAASYFGWNGNECSGMVLIDDRVFRMPEVGLRYLEHLIAHETCHQWWWNVVGTDGYAETFMDEGLVNCFTALHLDGKHGRNSPLINWPGALSWLPTIGREDLRLSGYYSWRAKGNDGEVIQDLGRMKNLFNLFSLAYDRGGKVIEMVRNRLGEERFFAFFRGVYRKYAWKTFHYDELKAELDAFDPTGNWPAFLDGWLLEHNETDWAVNGVKVSSPRDGQGDRRTVTIELKQAGTIAEPTVVLCKAGNDEIRVPIWPDRGDYEVEGARVRRADKTWFVDLESPSRPSQVIVDPDHALLDAVPDNNRWRPEVAWRFTPMMTPLDSSSQFQAYDRVSVVAGPFIDTYARGGIKAAAQRLNRWQISGWLGTEPALREAIFGGEAALLQFPWPMASVGFFYEQGMYNFYNDRRHSGGRFFLRHRLLETSSFLIDDQGFIEAYYGIGNEFWPGDDGRPVDSYLGAVGVRYRMSTLFPYWDPVSGRLVEMSAEYGNSLLGSDFNYARVTGEYGFVRALPEGLGWFSSTRYAFRVLGGYATPNDQPMFRLGGGRRLRAYDLSKDIGNAMYLVTLEWRFPIWGKIDRDVAYRLLNLNNLLGTVFYDGGQSFLDGQAYPFAQGVGVGLRLDTTLFSFLERANLRLDIAQPIGISRPGGPTLWFGLNQVF